MIKEFTKMTTTYVTFSLVMSASGASAQDVEYLSSSNPTVITKMVYPTDPTIRTQLTELDKIILDYEGQRKILETQRELEGAKQQTIRLEEWAESNLFIGRQQNIDKMIGEVVSYVGVTEYGFGTTPEIWDCSGLTKWYLAGIGVEVEHSATLQTLGGTKIVDPIAGDLVSFQKQGDSDYFHIGVYIGGGLMVHASNPEKDTNIQSVSEFADAENSQVVYVRY